MSRQAAIEAAIAAMEPEAAAVAQEVGWPEAVQMSLAISAKRLADALSGRGSNIFAQPLNCYGENIGECIEGQFKRAEFQQ